MITNLFLNQLKIVRISVLWLELRGSGDQELEKARKFSRMTGLALSWLSAAPQLVLHFYILASGVKAGLVLFHVTFIL